MLNRGWMMKGFFVQGADRQQMLLSPE